MTANWFDHLALLSAGLSIATLAAIPARALLRRDPSACYRLCLVLLFGSVALLPMQWIVQGIAHEVIAPARARLVQWLERAPASPEPGIPVDDPSDDVIRDPAGDSIGESIGDSILVQGPRAAAPEAEDEESTELAPAAALLAAAPRPSASRIAADWLRGTPGLALWALGIALVGGRRLLGLGRTARLLRHARPIDDPQLLALWRSVAAQSRIAGKVRLLASTELTAPACVGWLRPTLLLPAKAQPPSDPEALGWALRHELVHLERGDALMATLQSLLTALLWFHPAAWWLSAEIGRLRELSCDQVVVRGSGRRRSYALALLEYAAARHDGNQDHDGAIDAGPHSAGVRCALLHWSRSPSQIQRRIEMLMVQSGSGSWSRRAAGRLLALGAFVVPALAQVGAAATILPRDGGKVHAVAAAPASDPACVPAAAAECDDGKKVHRDPAAKATHKKQLNKADLEKLHQALARLHLASQSLVPEHAALARHLHEVAAQVQCAAAAESVKDCEDLKDALAEVDELDEIDELAELAELGYVDGQEFQFDLGDLELELADLNVELGDLDFDLGDVDFAMDDDDLAKVKRKVAQAMKEAGVDADIARQAAAKAMAEAERQIAGAHAQFARAHEKAQQEESMRKRSAQGGTVWRDDQAKRELEQEARRFAEHAHVTARRAHEENEENRARAAPHADPTIRQSGAKRSSAAPADPDALHARIEALEAELEALRAELDARKYAEHAKQKASKSKRIRSM